MSESLTLRPYQQRAVDAAVRNYGHGVKRQVLTAPCGAGKTVIALSILDRAARSGRRGWFLADLQTLVEQTSRRFHQFGLRHGVCMGARNERLSDPVIVASSQTLESRGMDWWQAVGDLPDLVLIDEAHTVRTKMLDMLGDIPVIGLTATPFRLGDHYDEVVNVATIKELEADGHLVPVKVVASPLIDESGLRESSTGEYVVAEVGERVNRIVADIVPEWRRRTKEYFGGAVQTVVFLPRVRDAEDTAAAFRADGIDARVVHGAQPVDVKLETVQAFERGEFPVVCNVAVLSKGADFPSARCMIDAYPLSRSMEMHVQKVGRILRPAPGKDFALLVDLCQRSNWLGFQDPFVDYRDHGVQEMASRKDGKAARKEEGKRAGACPECGAVWEGKRPKTCPVCGFEIPAPEGITLVVGGGTVEIDVPEGVGAWKGTDADLWRECCRVATKAWDNGFGGLNEEKASSRAYATFKGIKGRRPDHYLRFTADYDPPHPVIAAKAKVGYRAWQRRPHREEIRQSAVHRPPAAQEGPKPVRQIPRATDEEIAACASCKWVRAHTDYDACVRHRAP